MSDPSQSAPPPGAQALWGAPQVATSPGRSPAPHRPAGSGTALEPLSRRLLRLAGVLSVLLLLVVANSLLRSDENPFNPVAAAAAKTENCPGFRFTAYIVYSTPALPEPITASGAGVYNTETKRSRMSIALNSSITGQIHLEQISDPEYTFERGDVVAKLLPPGKEWVRSSKDAENDETPSADFDESMQILSSSGGVHVVGRESIDGRMTRHYRAEVQLAEFVQLLREDGKDEAAEAYEALEGAVPTGISADVWIDGKKMMRRMRVVMPVPGKEGQPPFTMDMRMDLFGYGVRPDIQLPDPDTVIDKPVAPTGSTASAQVS